MNYIYYTCTTSICTDVELLGISTRTLFSTSSSQSVVVLPLRITEIITWTWALKFLGKFFGYFNILDLEKDTILVPSWEGMETKGM